MRNRANKLSKPINKIPSYLGVPLLVLILLLIQSKYCKPAFAEDLNGILDALNKQDLGQGELEEKLPKDSWLDPKTNLAKIFAEQGKGALYIVEWLGDLTDREFKLIDKFQKRQREYVSLKVNYDSKTRTRIVMTVLVPHPKFIDLISSGLLDEFHDQEPPGLSVVATEKMTLKNQEAQYYQHKNGGCSLLFKLPKNATLRVSDEKCLDNREIVKLAELLGLERLKQKLEI